jgi:putative transposase
MRYIDNFESLSSNNLPFRRIEYAKKFPKPIIALEDLSELENNRRTKTQRYELSIWARKRIQEYIAYKALWEGIPCIMISPHYTSKNCNKCGERGERNGWQFNAHTADIRLT